MNNLIYRLDEAKKWLNENNIPFEIKTFSKFSENKEYTKACKYIFNELSVKFPDDKNSYEMENFLLKHVNFHSYSDRKNDQGEYIYYLHINELTNIEEMPNFAEMTNFEFEETIK